MRVCKYLHCTTVVPMQMGVCVRMCLCSCVCVGLSVHIEWKQWNSIAISWSTRNPLILPSWSWEEGKLFKSGSGSVRSDSRRRCPASLTCHIGCVLLLTPRVSPSPHGEKGSHWLVCRFTQVSCISPSTSRLAPFVIFTYYLYGFRMINYRNWRRWKLILLK